MTEMLLGQSSPRGLDPWGERMLAPDEVAAVVQLHKLGWGTKRIAGELRCSRNTVKRYLAAGGWVALRHRAAARLRAGLTEQCIPLRATTGPRLAHGGPQAPPAHRCAKPMAVAPRMRGSPPYGLRGRPAPPAAHDRLDQTTGGSVLRVARGSIPDVV